MPAHDEPTWLCLVVQVMHHATNVRSIISKMRLRMVGHVESRFYRFAREGNSRKVSVRSKNTESHRAYSPPFYLFGDNTAPDKEGLDWSMIDDFQTHFIPALVVEKIIKGLDLLHTTYPLQFTSSDLREQMEWVHTMSEPRIIPFQWDNGGRFLQVCCVGFFFGSVVDKI